MKMLLLDGERNNERLYGKSSKGQGEMGMECPLLIPPIVDPLTKLQRFKALN
jgi:hypothetical protein